DAVDRQRLLDRAIVDRDNEDILPEPTGQLLEQATTRLDVLENRRNDDQTIGAKAQGSAPRLYGSPTINRLEQRRHQRLDQSRSLLRHRRGKQAVKLIGGRGSRGFDAHTA